METDTIFFKKNMFNLNFYPVVRPNDALYRRRLAILAAPPQVGVASAQQEKKERVIEERRELEQVRKEEAREAREAQKADRDMQQAC